MKIAFAGSFAVRFAEPVRDRLSIPCEIIAEDETKIVAQLADADVLVSMAFTQDMATAGPRLRLVQVPGAGLDRIDRRALRPGTGLANTYGHEAGIAEYIIGAMIALTRSFGRIDAKLRRGKWESQWAVDALAPPLWPELAGKTLGILGFGHIGEALARRARAFDMKVCGMRRPIINNDPNYSALLALGLDIEDAQHLFVAIKNACEGFLTCDRPIGRRAPAIARKFGLLVQKPSEFVASQGW